MHTNPHWQIGLYSSQVYSDDNNNKGKTQTCTSNDLQFGVTASTPVERYTEKSRLKTGQGKEKHSGKENTVGDKWEGSGRHSQKQRRSGSREANVARPIKKKGHVQEETV